MKKIFLSIVLGWLPLLAVAYDFEVDGVYYNITDKELLTAEVTSGDKPYRGTVTIPMKAKDYWVTAIGDGAFKDCKDLQALDLRNTSYEWLKRIGDDAFRNSGLSETDMVTLVFGAKYIGDRAFMDCKNLNVEFTFALWARYIGAQAFENMPLKGKLMLASHLGTQIGERAFANTQITEIDAETDKSLSILAESFWGCSKLNKFKFDFIKNGVLYIGEHAFEGCESMSMLHLITNVPEVAENAFGDLADAKTREHLSNMTLLVPSVFFSEYLASSELLWKSFKHITDNLGGEQAEIDGLYYLLDKDRHTAEVTSSWSLDLQSEQNRWIKAAESIVVPATIEVDGETYVVKSIGRSAFSYFNNLKSITLPEGLWRIAGDAFHDCSLESISIPNSVIDIGSYAFRNCKKLKLIVIGDGIRRIGHEAFAETDVSDIYIHAPQIPKTGSMIWGDAGHDGWKGLLKKKLHVPASLVKDYREHEGEPWKFFADENIIAIGTTAINNAKTVPAEAARYALDGRRLGSPVRGVNIVRMNDGSVRKVLVK